MLPKKTKQMKTRVASPTTFTLSRQSWPRSKVFWQHKACQSVS